MKRCLLGLLALIAFSAAADEPVLSPSALGDISFGSKLSDIEARMRESAAPENGYGDESCRYVSFRTLPGTLFMIENGVVTRADVASSVTNFLGIPVGAAMEDVVRSHPEAQVTEHKYDPDGHYLTFPSSDGRFAIVMEVGGGKVTDIRGGLIPSVEYVEGCL